MISFPQLVNSQSILKMEFDRKLGSCPHTEPVKGKCQEIISKLTSKLKQLAKIRQMAKWRKTYLKLKC